MFRALPMSTNASQTVNEPCVPDQPPNNDPISATPGRKRNGNAFSFMPAV